MLAVRCGSCCLGAARHKWSEASHDPQSRQGGKGSYKEEPLSYKGGAFSYKWEPLSYKEEPFRYKKGAS